MKGKKGELIYVDECCDIDDIVDILNNNNEDIEGEIRSIVKFRDGPRKAPKLQEE